MESNSFVYLLLIILTTFFAYFASKKAIIRNKELWETPSFYLMLFTFAFIAGTRYMVGVDYNNYMEIMLDGDKHYYYHQIEFLCRFLVDILHELDLEFYWWFIIMAFLQLFFISIAIKDELKRVFPWIIYSFFLLYIGFYLNGVRQGTALSCFVFAVMFIKKRKLYHYLAFMFVGSLFHKSILFWIPVYWLVNKELFKNIKKQYLLLFVSIFFMPYIIDKLINITLPYWNLIGYDNKEEMININDKNIAIGSGLGVIFRYLRWCIIIFYYNKLKNLISKDAFIPLYNLFFIGILLYSAVYQNVFLSRVTYYGCIIEIIILGSLFYYMTVCKNKREKILLSTFIILQTILSFINVLNGTFEWYTIWDVPQFVSY